MFSFNIRKVVEEQEAKLRHPLTRDRRGKVERKEYADGEHRMCLQVNRLPVPEGADVLLAIEGQVVATIPTQNGRCRLDLRSTDPAEVPQALCGQQAQIYHEGQLLLEGVFYRD